MLKPVGFTSKEWNAGKLEATEILSRRATERAMITYSELSRQIHSIQIPYDDPAMGEMLGEISSEESRNGRGMLSVIVVHKYGDMEPGPGFFELAGSLGHDVSDRTAFWVSELHRVHGYWSNRTA